MNFDNLMDKLKWGEPGFEERLDSIIKETEEENDILRKAKDIIERHYNEKENNTT